MPRPTVLLLLLAATLPNLGGCAKSDRVEVSQEPRPTATATLTATATASTLPGGVTTPSAPTVFGAAPEGLSLAIALDGPSRVFEPGANISVKAKLVNASDKPISLVLPGDGSYKGWREPRIHFTAESKDSTHFRPMPTMDPTASCGVYDENWQDDVTTLAPHSELAVSLWSYPNMFIDFDQADEVRLRAHYEYARGNNRRSGGDIPALLKDTPAFALLSNPVTFRVERPIEITVEAIGAVEVGAGSPLSEVLVIRLHNRSDKPRQIGSPYSGRGSHNSLWIRSEEGIHDPYLAFDSDAPAATQTLAPGQTLTLLGPGEVFSSQGSHWTVDAPLQLRVRAWYGRSEENYQLRSAWVTLQAR